MGGAVVKKGCGGQFGLGGLAGSTTPEASDQGCNICKDKRSHEPRYSYALSLRCAILDSYVLSEVYLCFMCMLCILTRVAVVHHDDP
jgi:hypothetical protein